jgi:microcystin-dependent protein/ABC-type transporter Mla subunit MlaD
MKNLFSLFSVLKGRARAARTAALSVRPAVGRHSIAAPFLSLFCHSRENGNPVLRGFLIFVSAFCLLTSTFPAAAGTLTVANGVATNITASNAVLWVTLSDTNSTNTTLTCYYGTGNGGTNTSYWQYSNQWGVATVATNVSITTTNTLSGRTWYYYRWRAIGSNTVWASSSSNFTTLSRQVTNWPDVATNEITQMVDTNGLWLTPSRAKVLTANNLATNGAFASFDAIAAESNRAVSVEQQLGAAVTNLNTATNSLDTRADSLETSTGTLNTAVGNLQTSTGALNSAVSDLNAATGSLNSVVANILTATGALNSAVADLQTSTGALNSAVVQLQTDTGTIWTAVETLNTATNNLNGRVADLEGGGDAAGWSGFAATQEVFWSYQASISTNIVVTQIDATPNPAGTYIEIAEYDGHRQWYSAATGYSIWWDTLSGGYYMLGQNGVLNWIAASGPEGTYNDDSEGTTGSASASYSVVTNISTWRAGALADDPQGWKLSLGNTNLYRAYGTSNVFDKPIYGDGANITSVNATNAVTLAGLLASDYAKQANYAATSNLVDLTKSIADGLNSVSSMVNRVTTADYPALSNLVDSVKALADGLNSESNNWHVAFTSAFHGAGSTGRVTSEAGDATKFLKGDGTWSDTPAAAYGTTDSTAARGDWFAAVSGRVDNLITATQTLNTATNSLQSQININMPVGVILAYGASNAPTGWLLCDGAAVSRSTYAALFGVVGTTYGAGDESTTFNVPNLVERFPLGHTNLLGVASGTNQVTLTTNQIPQHVHQGPSGNLFLSTVSSGGTHDRPTSGNIAILSALTGPQLEPGGQSHTNMPPNLTVNYIIKH